MTTGGIFDDFRGHFDDFSVITAMFDGIGRRQDEFHRPDHFPDVRKKYNIY